MPNQHRVESRRFVLTSCLNHPCHVFAHFDFVAGAFSGLIGKGRSQGTSIESQVLDRLADFIDNVLGHQFFKFLPRAELAPVPQLHRVELDPLYRTLCLSRLLVHGHGQGLLLQFRWPASHARSVGGACAPGSWFVSRCFPFSLTPAMLNLAP